ncbi:MULTISPECIES: site-2 protease family protein [unclassified Kutzneria]|uniref:site-2 protease family protein n=1 Tax=unclassified Kutzneria TaxID=2621979 RepID=UPI0012F96E0E|nr:site-2 protease family protein [Kutzneria sp. 744]
MNRSSVRPSPLFLGLLGMTVIGAVLCALPTATQVYSNSWLLTVGVVLFVIGGWVVSLCLHEFGHAIVAFRGGDHEVAARGYLTLDPRRYTDPVMSILLPLIYLIIGGIPLPGGAVLINHWALRSKPVESLVSFAGPLFNLLIGLVLNVVVLAAPLPAGLQIAFSYLAFLQVFTFFFNILPVPGFDGFGVIAPWLSREAQAVAVRVRPWAPLVLFALIIAVRPVSAVFFTIGRALFGLVGGDMDLASLGDYFFRFWSR